MGQDSQRSLTSHRDESILPDELTPLLTKLHARETPLDQPDEYATVAAVCEATGVSPERVWEVLEEIRHQDLEARIEQRLREAEEPLYRVERPGTFSDPLDSSTNLLARRRAIKTILDHLPKVDRHPRHSEKLKVSNENKKPAIGERLAGNIVLITTLLLFLATIGFAIMTAMRSH